MASIEASARGPRFAFVTALPVVFYLVAGAVGRLVLFHCTTLPATLLDRMELASPLTSFRRCESSCPASRETSSRGRCTQSACSLTRHLAVAVREGVFLFQRGMDPYNGGTFNHVGCLFPPRSSCTSAHLLPQVAGLPLALLHDPAPDVSDLDISRLEHGGCHVGVVTRQDLAISRREQSGEQNRMGLVGRFRVSERRHTVRTIR